MPFVDVSWHSSSQIFAMWIKLYYNTSDTVSVSKWLILAIAKFDFNRHWIIFSSLNSILAIA